MNYNLLQTTDIEKLKRLAIIQSEFYGWATFCYEKDSLTFSISLNDVFTYASDAYSVAEEEVDEIFDIIMNEKDRRIAYNKIILYIANKLGHKGRIELLPIK